MVGTPIGTIEMQWDKGEKNTFKVKRGDIPNAKLKIVTEVAKEEVVKFAETLKKNMIFQINSYPFKGKNTKFQPLTSGNKGSLRAKIISAIETAKITRGTDENGNFKVSFGIDEPLAMALNDGTGIYNKNNPRPITAKGNHRYMFIPGYEFARSLMSQKLKSMGVTPEGMKGEITKSVRRRRSKTKDVAGKEFEKYMKR